VYANEIHKQRLTLTRVGIHHAVMSIFEQTIQQGFRLNYHVKPIFFEKLMSGDLILVAGNLQLSSTFTYASEKLYFAALYLGQHHVIGGYVDTMDDDLFEEIFLNLRVAFRNSDISEITQTIHRSFTGTFSIQDVFHDEREFLIERILSADIHSAEDSYRSVYDRTYTLMDMLRQQKKSIPSLLRSNLVAVINADLKNWFTHPAGDIHKLDQLTESAIKWEVPLDAEHIGQAAARRLYDMVQHLAHAPHDMSLLDTLSKVIIRLHELKLKYRLWKIQNKYFRIGRDFINNKAYMRSLGDEEYKKWLLKFKAVGEQLKIRF
jgi:hypothetical protein